MSRQAPGSLGSPQGKTAPALSGSMCCVGVQQCSGAAVESEL